MARKLNLRPWQELFWSKVEKTESCWLWAGAKRSKSRPYGSVTVHGEQKAAHRLSFEMHYGPIPGGMLICHKCDTPLCVNPSHLFLGTTVDNAKDMVNKGRNHLTGLRGSQMGSAKLTEAQVIAILADTRQYKTIAEAYGVSRPRISMIKNRKEWRHVECEPKSLSLGCRGRKAQNAMLAAGE